MKADLRTYILGGKVSDPMLSPDGPCFTSIVKTSDMVFTPSLVGEMAALWATVMIMRESVSQTDFYFDDYVFIDTVSAGGEARGLKYRSNFNELDWWSNQFSTIAAIEEAMASKERNTLAVSVNHGISMIAALDWFVSRFRCRPPPIASIGSNRKATISNPDELKGLSPSEKNAINAMRKFEASRFAFMESDGFVELEPEKKPEEEKKPEPTEKKEETVAPVVVKPGTQWGDREEHYSYIDIMRMPAPDGFRDEDRAMLDKFKRIMARFVPVCPPIKSKFIEPNYKSLGEQLFAINQVLQRTTFPDPDMVVRKEEEMRAEAIRKKREEAKNGQPGAAPG